MKKTIITLIIIGSIIVTGIWMYSSSKMEEKKQSETNKNASNYQAERSDTNINMNINESNISKKEIPIASFSTKIYGKDKARENNIGIACRTISTKEVQPGEEFSFSNTVGKATTAKGYQEADIYVKGKKEKGVGGGNCQVSTTLYNAVLQVPGLEVTEKHQHSGPVPYVQPGMDAAVSYGSYDFKFKNNTNNVVKIMMENTADNITATLLKIE